MEIYDVAQGNFTLQTTSPAIDAGDTSGVLGTYIDDLDLNIKPRFTGTKVDICAIEYNPSTGFKERMAGTSVRIFPNPVQNELHIESENIIEKARILDLSGKTILESEEKRINVEKMPSGTYLIVIQSGEEISKQLFIKL